MNPEEICEIPDCGGTMEVCTWDVEIISEDVKDPQDTKKTKLKKTLRCRKCGHVK
jgi:hypothetical protein